MKEYTLRKIVRNQKVSTRTGKPYESIGIQVVEFPDIWINGFGNKETANWKEGDKISVLIQDHEYNGKISKQFNFPKKEDVNSKALEEINVKLTTIKMLLNELVLEKRKNDKPKVSGTDIDYPQEELADNPPF
jgi:hypothetical protein